MTDTQKVRPKPSCCSNQRGSDIGSCSCAQPSSTEIRQESWIAGRIDTSMGPIPQIKTCLSWTDKLGSWKSRWDIGRMDYKVAPGLYGVGKPDDTSPVLVSANYKMSFDRLRQELGGLDLWILVLDTKGINVWCAAGKGTFGTRELINRISQTRLPEVVTHRQLIIPQLGAPGICAHEVFKMSGFRIQYGPVRSADIPEYLKAGMKPTAGMREVHFGLMDRLVLTPIEIVGTFKPGLVILGLLAILNIIFHSSLSVYQFLGRTILDFLPFLGAIFTGTVLVPVLLPVIPGRALAFKGWLLGLVWAGIYLKFLTPAGQLLHIVTYILLLPPLVSYLAMNFTGSTTYTSLSGVVKEMKIAVPAQIISAGVGIVCMIGELFA